jgi:pilus assembly protein CpaE
MRCIIISPDRELASHLEAAVTGLAEVALCRTLHKYPTQLDLLRTLRTHGPELIFLSFESTEKAVDIVKSLEAHKTGVQVIAIHQVFKAEILRDTMRSGVREFLAEPFERQALVESLRHVKDLLELKPVTLEVTGEIFTFLPSKAGVGTTTLALNISAALARRPNTQVLLSDFDLSSGMLRFLLKLENEYSVLEAMENASRMDEHLWPQLVNSMGNLHVLHAGRLNPSLRIDPAQIHNLVEFMRRNYEVLCFDISGNLERHSLELMHESKRVILVCTPEIASLHLAREKLAYLKSLELDQRVCLILNRCHKRPLFSKEQVENLLGLPVLHSFSNDYHLVNRAAAAAKWLDPTSDLGKQFSQFAKSLLEPSPVPPAPEPKKGKFLEFFSIPSTAIPTQD